MAVKRFKEWEGPFGRGAATQFVGGARLMEKETDHLLILEEAFFQNLTWINFEYGGIGLDPKRPFGNSDVEQDILEIIGVKPEGKDGTDRFYDVVQRDYAACLYNKLLDWLRNKYANTSKNTGWQPIDTAPADIPELEPQKILIWVSDGGDDRKGDIDIGRVYIGRKTLERRPKATSYFGDNWEITHWMPLPEPPGRK